MIKPNMNGFYSTAVQALLIGIVRPQAHPVTRHLAAQVPAVITEQVLTTQQITVLTLFQALKQTA